MAVHHGGKVGASGRRLASKSSSKSTKSKAAKILVNQKTQSTKEIQSKGGLSTISIKTAKRALYNNFGGLYYVIQRIIFLKKQHP